MLKTLDDLEYKQKTVIYRTDYNIPLGDRGKVEDWQSWRIEATLPTLKKLIKADCKIIIITHLGRPDGRKDGQYSIKPAAKKLAQYLKRELRSITPKEPHKKLQKIESLTQPCYLLQKDEERGKKFKSLAHLNNGDILILENLRFDPGEKNEPSQKFARTLSKLADIYVSDAFAAAHRKHASVYFLPQVLPAVAGKLLEKEDQTLARIRKQPKNPPYLILGGAKVKTKITLIESFLPKLKGVLLGGVIANTLLAAKGHKTGTSEFPEKEQEKLANLTLEKEKIHLPLDVKTAPSPQADEKKINERPVQDIPSDEMILDIGPKTIKHYKEILSDAREIIWNGNLGLSEIEAFAQGSREIGEKIAHSNAHSVVGGGDTVAFLRKKNLAQEINFCSTGGGAMLEHLAGIKLPGIEVLEK